MTLPPPLTIQFWTIPEPPPFQTWSTYLVLVVVVAMVITGVVAAVVSARPGLEKMMRRALGRAAGLLITMGLAGLALYSFSYERIAYFSMRAGWIVWLVIVGVWAYGIIRYVMVDIPAARKVQAEREKLEKWLPKRKK